MIIILSINCLLFWRVLRIHRPRRLSNCKTQNFLQIDKYTSRWFVSATEMSLLCLGQVRSIVEPFETRQCKYKLQHLSKRDYYPKIGWHQYSRQRIACKGCRALEVKAAIDRYSALTYLLPSYMSLFPIVGVGRAERLAHLVDITAQVSQNNNRISCSLVCCAQARSHNVTCTPRGVSLCTEWVSGARNGPAEVSRWPISRHLWPTFANR